MHHNPVYNHNQSGGEANEDCRNCIKKTVNQHVNDLNDLIVDQILPQCSVTCCSDDITVVVAVPPELEAAGQGEVAGYLHGPPVLLGQPLVHQVVLGPAV